MEQEGENSRRPDEGKDLRISRWSVRWGRGEHSDHFTCRLAWPGEERDVSKYEY